MFLTYWQFRAGNDAKETVREKVERLWRLEFLRDLENRIGGGQDIVDHAFDRSVDSVRVHLLEERVTSVEQVVEVVNLLRVEANLLVDDSAELQEPITACQRPLVM